MQAFEALLEHLRAANCGEAPPRLPDDPGRLSALHREALHFALPGRHSTPVSLFSTAKTQDHRRGSW